MQITFDPDKRDKTLIERGVDFADAAAVLAGHHFTGEDTRQDYGEVRFITVGLLTALSGGNFSGDITASYSKRSQIKRTRFWSL